MSQTWTDDVFAAGHVGQTDLQNMENNFGCLKSLFSGASQPASMAACHPWFDTTKHVLKVRNDGDSAWYGLMHGDTSQKVWIYRNAAMNGWAIDSGVSDKVLALKGGSVYTAGGATAGTWTQPNHTHTMKNHTHTGASHNHQWYDSINGNDDKSYDSGGSPSTIGGSSKDAGDAGIRADGGGWDYINSDRYTSNAGTGATGAPNDNTSDGGATANTYRPAAAVGTLQYLDL